MVESALARGHRVTTFNRGRTNPNLHPGVERLTGDRNGDLSALEGASFDAAVDTSAYRPRQVAAVAERLRGGLGAYCLVSSVSVYPLAQAAKSEDSPTLEPPPEGGEDVDAHYGALKAMCEREAVAAYGMGAVLNVRSGLLAGPWDPTNRFTYWVRRIAAGGEVLAPEGPGTPVQLIDARDVAGWIVDCLERGVAGTYNCTGPEEPVPLGRLFEIMRRVAGSEATFTWADGEFLQAHGVAPWTGLPLWIPASLGSLHDAPIDRALAAGLSLRPLERTVADTLAWTRTAGHGTPPVDSAGRARSEAGLAPERERELLAAWRNR